MKLQKRESPSFLCLASIKTRKALEQKSILVTPVQTDKSCWCRNMFKTTFMAHAILSYSLLILVFTNLLTKLLLKCDIHKKFDVIFFYMLVRYECSITLFPIDYLIYIYILQILCKIYFWNECHNSVATCITFQQLIARSKNRSQFLDTKRTVADQPSHTHTQVVTCQFETTKLAFLPFAWFPIYRRIQ